MVKNGVKHQSKLLEITAERYEDKIKFQQSIYVFQNH